VGAVRCARGASGVTGVGLYGACAACNGGSRMGVEGAARWEMRGAGTDRNPSLTSSETAVLSGTSVGTGGEVIDGAFRVGRGGRPKILRTLGQVA
jgi:hypothetical protein